MTTIEENNIIGKACAIIKDFEKFKEFAYLDSGGVWTYGYGFTKTPMGNPVKKNDWINKNDSDKFIEKIVKSDFEEIKKVIKQNLNKNQLSALLSFVYNIGLTRFRRSTLLSLINKKADENTISKEFLKWVYDNGQIVRGLQNRRSKEVNIYFTKEIGNLNL